MCSDFQKFFVCIQFVDFRGVLQNRICFSVYHSGQCHGMIAIVSLVDDKRNTRTLSIAVRYQNACHNIKIRCNNSSVLALSFLRLLAFSRDLALLSRFSLRVALSFRWRVAINWHLNSFPLELISPWFTESESSTHISCILLMVLCSLKKHCYLINLFVIKIKLIVFS